MTKNQDFSRVRFKTVSSVVEAFVCIRLPNLVQFQERNHADSKKEVYLLFGFDLLPYVFAFFLLSFFQFSVI